MIKNSFSFFIIVSLWYNTDIKIGICKGDIQHEESLLSGFASFNNSVRIITLGSSLYFCNISNRKSKRNIQTGFLILTGSNRIVRKTKDFLDLGWLIIDGETLEYWLIQNCTQGYCGCSFVLKLLVCWIGVSGGIILLLIDSNNRWFLWNEWWSFND